MLKAFQSTAFLQEFWNATILFCFIQIACASGPIMLMLLPGYDRRVYELRFGVEFDTPFWEDSDDKIG